MIPRYVIVAGAHHHAVHDFVRDRSQHGVELVEREETQVGVDVALPTSTGPSSPWSSSFAGKARTVPRARTVT
jgi:hypothetical protein